MASSSKKKTTMAKLNREAAVGVASLLACPLFAAAQPPVAVSEAPEDEGQVRED